jgi:hypothetical protein
VRSSNHASVPVRRNTTKCHGHAPGSTVLNTAGTNPNAAHPHPATPYESTLHTETNGRSKIDTVKPICPTAPEKPKHPRLTTHLEFLPCEHVFASPIQNRVSYSTSQFSTTTLTSISFEPLQPAKAATGSFNPAQLTNQSQHAHPEGRPSLANRWIAGRSSAARFRPRNSWPTSCAIPTEFLPREPMISLSVSVTSDK